MAKHDALAIDCQNVIADCLNSLRNIVPDGQILQVTLKLQCVNGSCAIKKLELQVSEQERQCPAPLLCPACRFQLAPNLNETAYATFIDTNGNEIRESRRPNDKFRSRYFVDAME